MYCQACVRVTELSQVGEARRELARVAAEAGFDEDHRGKLAIIATELATNLAKYAQQGEVLLRTYDVGGTAGVEVLALDRGPGMANVARCLEDGYSSGGTAGNGLGAVRRLATTFDVYSSQPQGTIVLARVRARAAMEPKPRFEWGVVNLPAPKEFVSGDTWRIGIRQNQLAAMIADGLGHGPQAFEAADVAGQVFDGDGSLTSEEFLAASDRRMRGTRGAAVAFARLDASQGKVKFAGVGNIAGTIRSRGTANNRGLMSHNGTVGVTVRKVQEFEYDCPQGAILIMHSDGLQSRWNLADYPGLIERHPAIIAAVLYRDYCRGRDDVTVCVIRASA